MTALIIAEHNNKNMNKETRHVVKAAKLIDPDLWVVVMGSESISVCKEAALINGVSKILHIQNECLKDQLPEICSIQINEILKKNNEINAVLISTSTYGKELLPRIAALQNMNQISDVAEIHSPNIFLRPIYAGNLMSKVKCLEKIKFLTIRITKFDADEELEVEKNVKIEDIFAITHSTSKQILGNETSSSNRPDLLSARVVVSGGRGLGSKENYKNLLEPLAEKLNAALGASRAAVDSGFAPNEFQIGQTGKVIAPDLYFAIGMSGSVQHLAGMKDSKVIVAINKDPEAPIFQIATFGLVADLFDAIPVLTNNL